MQKDRNPRMTAQAESIATVTMHEREAIAEVPESIIVAIDHALEGNLKALNLATNTAQNVEYALFGPTLSEGVDPEGSQKIQAEPNLSTILERLHNANFIAQRLNEILMDTRSKI